jgi:arylsulfatase A-like enzyme
MGSDLTTRADSPAAVERRHFIQGMAVAAHCKVFGSGGQKRPNILYIHSHDTGRYIQPYGHAVSTPNLQRLAMEGVLFRKAFSAAPTCSPSRASLLTGMYPHSNGMLGLAHRGFALKDYRQHIIHTLRAQAGYHSVLIGLQHIAQDPTVIGYDEVLPCPGNSAATVAPRAVEFLSRNPRQPFFLTIGFFETHREFHQPGPEEDPRFCLPPHPIPDTPQTRLDMAGFKASARVLDNAVGMVLRALESNGLADNTLVISTTDHGIAFPAMKCNLTDNGTGVYLIVRGPGGFRGGKISDVMVSQVDIFPTLCDLLEIKPPEWLQGRSLMPLLRGVKQEVHEELFAEVNYHAAYEPMRSVRTARWKYIRRWGGRTHPTLPNCDDGYSKSLWLGNGWRDRSVASEQLFDLIFDPNEVCNLADNPTFHEILEQMRRRLENWMQATEDPLLAGFVEAPRGARVNDPDGTSPREPVKIVNP